MIKNDFNNEYNKETLEEGGYKYIKNLGGGTHLLKNLVSGGREVWANNRGHASYGLKYKNTHLEFCGGWGEIWGI